MSPGQMPKTAKGALVLIKPKNQTTLTPDLFIFEYNPDLITRTLSYQDPTNPTHTLATPTEQITLTLELDATDNLEKPQQNPITTENGLHPQLATIETIMQAQQQINTTQENPTVVFHWGTNRITPVRLTSLTISEEAFDPKLNPTRTKIDLTMRVLQLSELKNGTKAYQICTKQLNQRNNQVALYQKMVDQSTLNFYGVEPTGVGTVTGAAQRGTTKKPTNQMAERPKA
jgi:Contractile injection system tube protein